MRFLSRSLVGLFLAALTAGLLVWAGQIVLSALRDRQADSGGGGPVRERVLAANVVTATPATVTPVMTAFGEIRARRVLELRVPVGGRIVDLAPGFEEGGRVEAGQTLLRLDPAGAEAALAVARTDLAGAEAELRDAERGLELSRAELSGAEAQRDLQEQALQRQRDLSERGVGAAAAIEGAALALSTAEQTILSRRGAVAQAETRVDAARLAIDRARIAVDNARRDLDDRTLTAGFAGQLTDVSVLRGGILAANERIATLIDPSALEVAFRLSAAQHARLLDESDGLIGAPVRAILDVDGLAIAARGTITREAAQVGDGQTGRLVFAMLDDPRGFRPGDFVRVEVEEPAIAAAMRLPATALSAQGSVLVLDAEDRLREAPVVLLRRQGDDVLVVGDIAGSEVVTERTAALGAGIRVRPLRAGAAPAPALVALDPERRARIVAFVESNTRIPAEVRSRMLTQLEAEEVPAAMVERLESRMGG
ncbi:HlyD family efflux transporter periplasmic adaptor subunit [Jannaschia sp. S6380]|uniref:efflux RND transporter periplasmic adaptor subunit n=1 Tax=Jannaschia sp. S6380 TaxID=2926408 RepID=UPI001FF30721|nr:HlyD family efflux transporter periplasmic adaptor subunit [Jannaschia sp. S6380]MCK0169129.1 HlyD family efflux transporter periplasmic adaptor subunit [Jannaschia sp. S6380]